MNIKVFDFFSGCGGTSVGFKAAGMEITYALDIDKDAAGSFKENFPEATVDNCDVRNVSPDRLKTLIKKDDQLLFCGCAPCQPFSKQNRHIKKNDPRRGLLFEFMKFVQHWLPQYVVVENVPGAQKLAKKGPMNQFVADLVKLGYSFEVDVLYAMSFGVPQRRPRLVLLASRIGESKLSLPAPTHGPGLSSPFATVRQWIGNLPPISAGERHILDSNHESAKLSELNLQRIKVTPEGGNRFDWPKRLWLDCHHLHDGHSDVYGRLHWDKPASGLTTKCISFSNGRFGHPDQDRALSIREAACLQTFPSDYKFVGSLGSRARQVGNAVPPLLAQRIGESIISIHSRYILRGK